MAGAGRPKCTSAEADRPGRGGAKRRDTEAALGRSDATGTGCEGRDGREAGRDPPGATLAERPARSGLPPEPPAGALSCSPRATSGETGRLLE